MKTSKLITMLSFVLLAFTGGDSKSEYVIPAYGRTLISVDLDLDGDIDIISGHNYFWQTEWSGFSFLQNDSFGNFSFTDSLYIYASQTNIYAINILGDETPEIIGRYYDGQQNLAIIEINDWDFNVTYHPMGPSVTSFNYGDISGNNSFDFAFISNNDFLWGIIYNDGTGNFSEPEYFDLTFPPVDINCADLNGDGRSDMVVCGSNTEIYYWTESGFEQQILTTTTSHDVLLSDFDNDGDKDIITHRTLIYPTHRVFFFENLGDNQFFEHTYFDFSPFCSFAQIADFNNDSLPDMIFSAYDYTGLYIFTNKDNFQLEYDQFIPIDNSSSRGLNCNDFDNNGFNDIAVIKEGLPQSILQLLFNDGQGSFQDNPITDIEIPTENQINPVNCYPNPFSGKTNIEINIDYNEQAILEIYDIQGKQIKAFDDMAFQTGTNKFIWEGKDQSGKEVKPGLYFVRLQSDRKVYTKRLVLLK